MGAISRVKLHYCELADELREATGQHIPVFGTFMDGSNIFSESLPSEAVIVMGNEGRGVSESVREVIDRRLTIPSYPPGEPTSESLNVASATAIILSQFRAAALK